MKKKIIDVIAVVVSIAILGALGWMIGEYTIANMSVESLLVAVMLYFVLGSCIYAMAKGIVENW